MDQFGAFIAGSMASQAVTTGRDLLVAILANATYDWAIRRKAAVPGMSRVATDAAKVISFVSEAIPDDSDLAASANRTVATMLKKHGDAAIWSLVQSGALEELAAHYLAVRLLHDQNGRNEAERAFLARCQVVRVPLSESLEIKDQVERAVAATLEATREITGLEPDHRSQEEAASAREQLAVGLRNTSSRLASARELALDAREMMTFLRRYRAEVCASTADLRLSHWDDSVKVPLTRVYVHPEVVRRSGKWRAAVLDIPRLSYGAVVVGDPGAGKTTMLRYIQHQLSAEGPSFSATPLFIPLVDYNKKSVEGVVTSFSDYLDHQARHLFAFQEVPDRFFEYVLRCVPAVVMFDGLDEISSVVERRGLRDAIQSFSRTCPGARVIVTSREVGYTLASFSCDDFDDYRMLPFSDSQIEAYAAAWFELNNPTDAPELQVRFLQQVKSVDLRPNPLALSLMCALFSTERDLPRTRAALYAKCTELFLHKWDVMRGISVHNETELAEQVLARLAYQLMRRSIEAAGAGLEVPRAELLEFVTQVIAQYRGQKEAARRDAESLLDVVCGRMWILATNDGQLFFFTHRTFLEYFAAVKIVEKHATSRALWQAIRQLLESGAWQVVTELAAQLYSDKKQTWADMLVEQVLKEPPSQTVVTYALSCPRFLTLKYKTVGSVVDYAVEAYLDVPDMQRAVSDALVELASTQYQELCSGAILRGAIAHARRAPELVSLAIAVFGGRSYAVLRQWVGTEDGQTLVEAQAKARWRLGVARSCSVSLPLAARRALADSESMEAADLGEFASCLPAALADGTPSLAQDATAALRVIDAAPRQSAVALVRVLVRRRLERSLHVPDREAASGPTLKPVSLGPKGLLGLWGVAAAWCQADLELSRVQEAWALVQGALKAELSSALEGSLDPEQRFAIATRLGNQCADLVSDTAAAIGAVKAAARLARLAVVRERVTAYDCESITVRYGDATGVVREDMARVVEVCEESFKVRFVGTGTHAEFDYDDLWDGRVEIDL